MARARSLKPGFFTDAELVECPFWVRLLFAGLWTVADREGRLDDRPKQIKMHVFPADDVDVEAGLAELAARGLIVRYEAGGGRYVLVKNFRKHQNPHKNEAPSSRPAPEQHGAGTVQAPEQHGATRADSGLLTPDSGLPRPRPPLPPRPDRARPDLVPENGPTPPTGNASREPTPLPVRSRPVAAGPPPESGAYAAELGEALPRLADICQGLHPQLGPAWLAATLVRVEADVGPLPRERLGRGIDLALDQFRRDLEHGGVKHPRGLLASQIREYLREQAHEHHAAHPAADPAPAGAGARPPPDRAADAAPGGRGPH